MKTDFRHIKSLADEHRHELGFVLGPALAAGITEGRIYVGTALSSSTILGFVHFRHRRDLVTKTYQICVQRQHRQVGIGRSLLDAVKDSAIELGQLCILLKCPEGLPANIFYQQVGFALLGIMTGKRRRLFTWKLSLPG